MSIRFKALRTSTAGVMLSLVLPLAAIAVEDITVEWSAEASEAVASETVEDRKDGAGIDEDLESILSLFEDNEEDFPLGFHMLFSTGYQQSQMSALSQPLQEKGYGALNQNFWSFGGSFQMVLWNVIAEFEGQAGLSGPVSNDDFLALVSAGNTLFNLGYQFKPHKNLRIYPLVGMGASFVDMQFRRRSQLPDFDSFLSQPGWYGQMGNSVFALNLGLGLEFQGFLGTVGLRGGYLFHPFPSTWWTSSVPGTDSDDGNNLSTLLLDGPALTMNGPYLKLVMGF